MVRMIAEVYDAFKSVGVPDDKARAAATALAAQSELERRFDEIDARFEHLEGRMDARFERVDARFERVDARFEALERRVGRLETDVAVLKWMVGANIGLTILVLGKLLLP